MYEEAKVLIKAGDVEIDLSGAQNSVDERLIRVKKMIHGQSLFQE